MLFLREKIANWQTKNYLKLNVHSAAYANMKWSQSHKDTQRTQLPLTERGMLLSKDRTP